LLSWGSVLSREYFPSSLVLFSAESFTIIRNTFANETYQLIQFLKSTVVSYHITGLSFAVARVKAGSPVGMCRSSNPNVVEIPQF